MRNGVQRGCEGRVLCIDKLYWKVSRISWGIKVYTEVTNHASYESNTVHGGARIDGKRMKISRRKYYCK